MYRKQNKQMGDFRIIIDAVGGHGQDRSKKDGEVVDFKEGNPDANTPESIAQELIEKLKSNGCSVQKATVTHWPADNYPEGREVGKEVVDDLITGVRKNQF